VYISVYLTFFTLLVGKYEADSQMIWLQRILVTGNILKINQMSWHKAHKLS